jgi:hypothetical protein
MAISTVVLQEPIRVVVDHGPGASWYDKPEFWAVLVPLLVAAFVAWRAQRQWLAQRAAAQRDALTAAYARALADAIAWTELPYRVARRTSDTPETLAVLVDRFHDLQERIEHHLRWLQLDSASVGAAYEQLVKSVKSRTESDIRAAWQRPPITTAAGMNIGPVSTIDISDEREKFMAAVRAHLNELERPRRRRRAP